MPYADNTDMILEFKGLAYGSLLSSATVDGWCTQAGNLIDTYVGTKYTVPVDSTASPKAFSVLKNICIELVRPRMAKFLQVQTSKTGASQASNTGDNTKTVMQTLADIRDAKVKLVDAVLASSADGVESFTNDNSGTLQPPTFTREGDDW